MSILYESLMATRAAQPAPRPAVAQYPAALTGEQVAAVDDTAEVMASGRLDFWPTSEGEHIVAVAADGRVRQVGGLFA